MKTFITLFISSIVSILIYFFIVISTEFNPFEEGIFTTSRLLFFSLYFSYFIPIAIISKKFKYKYYWAFPIFVVNVLVLTDFVGRSVHWKLYALIPFFSFFIMIISLLDFLAKIERHPAKIILLLIPILSNIYLIYLAIKVKNDNFISRTSEIIIWSVFILLFGILLYYVIS